MFNFFRKKKKVRKNITNADMAKTYVADIHKTEIEKVEPERTNIFEMRYMDTKTGEIFTFDSSDFDAFDKVMSNKDYKLIFS